MELAKLAAILGANLSPRAALNKAMEFYVAAVTFGDEEASLNAGAKRILAKQRADTLELDPRKDDDPARRFLAECGLPLKQSRSVLDNIRRSTPVGLGLWSAAQLINQCKQETAGRTIYAIPRNMLQAAVEHAKRNRRESKHKAWQTRGRKSSVK